MTQEQQGRASQPFDPPDRCPNCGAPLKDPKSGDRVPFDGTSCPHCGHDLESEFKGTGAG